MHDTDFQFIGYQARVRGISTGYRIQEGGEGGGEVGRGGKSQDAPSSVTVHVYKNPGLLLPV